MSIKICCSCGAEFKAKDELAGKRVKCPSCAQPFTVPDRTLSSLPVTSARSVAQAGSVAGGATQAGIGVWYASEDRVRSTSKMLVFDDRGVLQAAQNGLYFDGRKQQLSLSNIQQVSLVTQRFPWKVHLVIDVALIALFVLQAAIAAARGQVTGIGQVSALATT